MCREARETKWRKARPISPGMAHPMKRLLSYVGRAWSFVTSQLLGEHFVIQKTHEVPEFLEKSTIELAQHGKLACDVYEVEGCYPDMPKDAIRLGLRDAANEMRRLGRMGVWVPKVGTRKPCSWKPTGRHAKVWLSFEAMNEIMEFSLDHAYVKMPDGKLLWQKGYPNGGPD